MEDKLPTETVTSTPPEDLVKTPDAVDEWSPKPGSSLTTVFVDPEKPDTIEFRPQGDKPDDFEGVTVTIQVVKPGEDSTPENYSPQANNLPEVS